MSTCGTGSAIRNTTKNEVSQIDRHWTNLDSITAQFWQDTLVPRNVSRNRIRLSTCTRFLDTRRPRSSMSARSSVVPIDTRIDFIIWIRWQIVRSKGLHSSIFIKLLRWRNSLASNNRPLQQHRVSIVEVLDIAKDSSGRLASSSLLKHLKALPLKSSLDLEGCTLLEGKNLVVLETVGTPFAAEALVIASNSGGMSDRVPLTMRQEACALWDNNPGRKKDRKDRQRELEPFWYTKKWFEWSFWR